jgi:hypothetical protein
MTLYPFNPNMGQEIQGDGTAGHVKLDMGYLAHLHVAGSDATAADDDGIKTAVTRTGAVQHVTTMTAQPSCPRLLSVKGSLNSAVAATHTFNMTASLADLAFTAKTAGAPGNDITIEFIDPGTDGTLDVSVDGTAITVTLAYGVGAVTTTGALAKTAIDSTPAAAALVTVALEGNGSGLLNGMIAANLSGGVTKSAGNVVITGTGYDDAVLTDTIALNGTTGVNGVVAFKTVTDVLIPASLNATGDTVKVGFTEYLGLGSCLAHDTVLHGYLGNVIEGTRPVATFDVTTMDKNVVKLASSLNSSAVDVYFIV